MKSLSALNFRSMLKPRSMLLSFAAGWLFLMVVPSAHSQDAAKPIAPADYSKESTVIESIETVYTFASDGTGSKEITGVVAIHDDAGIKAWSVVTFPFASSAERVEIIYLRVRHTDGSVVETPAADAMQLPSPVTQQAPLYSDLMQEQIPVRGLREGDHLEYKLRLVRDHPEAPGHFWGSESFYTLSSGVVALKQTLELRLPVAGSAQVWSPKHKPVVSATGKEKIYRWETAQTLPVAGKTKNELLRLDTDATKDGEPDLPDVAWSNFKDWKEVGAWYRGLEGTRIAPGDDVRARAGELIAGKSTQEEKARAIYGFVGPRVRYIGVDFGIGRLQPHDASEVLRNQYGDCKDKATLQAAMLSAVGISADTALIGANEAFSADLPSPGWFNHAITQAHVDGKPVWLDATAEVAPYRMLLPMLRGKQALVVPATGDAYLATTPKDPPFPMRDEFKADGTLDDQGTSVSKMDLTLRGDSEIIFRAAVRSVSPAQWDELMQQISYAMSYSGKVTHTEFSRPDDTAAPFRLSYEYTREKNGDWDSLRILPQLPPMGLPAIDEKDLPVLPIQLGGPDLQIAHTTMKLPQGWSAELPDDIHAKSSFATLDKTYKFENGTLITERRYQSLQEKLPATEWRTYKKWYKDAGLDGETYVQLMRTGASRSAAEYNEDAARLVSEAVQLEQSQAWDGAKQKLDDARALNSQQAFLWSNYGYLALQYGKLNEAVEDCRREITNHPAEDVPYRLLASIQLQQHKPADAEATLRLLLVQHPGDELGALMLAAALVEDKNPAEATLVLRASVAANTESLPLKLQLGRTLVVAGKKDEAEPFLTEVLNKTDEAGQLNDAGYELADASLDIPLAEKSIRRALELIDEMPTGDNLGARHKALQRATLIVATWDSLGWALYRESKLAEAETWVRAAWRNGQQLEPGYHLAVILMDQGKNVEAANILQLAKASALGGSADTTLLKLIEGREATLKSVGAKSSVKDPKAKLQQERTFHVDRASTTTGWASFDVELSSHGTVSVWATEGDLAMKMLDGVVKSIDLHADIPPDSQDHLLRRGLLSCHTTCEFVLVPIQQAVNEKEPD